MGQYDILDFLDANAGTWFTTRDISERLDMTMAAASRGNHKLLRGGLARVRFMLVKDRNTGYKYHAVLGGHKIEEFTSRKTIDKETMEV